MFERNNSLNASLSSFEDNNDFFPLHQLSWKDNSLFDYRLFSQTFPSDFLCSSFLEETPDINFLTREIREKPNIISNQDKLVVTSINKTPLKKIEKNVPHDPPAQYTFDKIQNIIRSLNLPDDIRNIFVKDSNLTRIDKEMSDKVAIGKKKRRKKGKIKFTEEKENKKIGRKKNNDYTKRKHDRNWGDNIIKKIKLKFIEYCLRFLNNILKSNIAKEKLNEYKTILQKNKRYIYGEESENLIKSLDYKFIDKIKKEKELLLLKKPLKEIFSNKISPKYSTLPPDYNKNLIEIILNKEKDNSNIMFAFNLTFEEWINVFTYKRNLESFENFDKNKMEEINNKFDKVEKLINEMYQKHYNHNYLSYFICYIFNYKRWFIMKKGRNRISNKEKKL